jgi:hypothetical protein
LDKEVVANNPERVLLGLKVYSEDVYIGT